MYKHAPTVMTSLLWLMEHVKHALPIVWNAPMPQPALIASPILARMPTAIVLTALQTARSVLLPLARQMSAPRALMGMAGVALNAPPVQQTVLTAHTTMVPWTVTSAKLPTCWLVAYAANAQVAARSAAAPQSATKANVQLVQLEMMDHVLTAPL
jgi:hypothetical protein